MCLLKLKIILAIVIFFTPTEVFSMEWEKRLPLAVAQDVYPAIKRSLLFCMGNEYVFIYKNGYKSTYTIVTFDSNGNIKRTVDYDILPDFSASTKGSTLLLGKDLAGNNIYTIINSNNIYSYKYGNLVIPLSAFSIRLNNKDMFMIFYGDADQGTVEDPAIVYKVIDEEGNVVCDGKIPSDLLGIVHPYIYNGNIYLLTKGRDRSAHIIKLSSGCVYYDDTKLDMHFFNNIYFKKYLFISGKIFVLAEYDDNQCLGYVFDIKTSQFSTVNFYPDHNRVNDVVVYSKNSIALVYGEYIILYNLSENKEYIAYLDSLKFSITHILPLEDNEIIVSGNSQEPTGGFHPILKRVTIHPVPR